MKVKKLTKEYLEKHLENFLYLEGEWTGLGEQAWAEKNFMLELPSKWELSSYVNINSKLAGYAIVSTQDEKQAYLNKIIVDSGHQGIGIGSLLLKKSIERCRKKGIEKIIFKVRTDNDAANNLYKKYGVVYKGKETSPDNVERYLCELSINKQK